MGIIAKMAGAIRIPNEAREGLLALASMPVKQYKRLTTFVQGLSREAILSVTLDRALLGVTLEDRGLFFGILNHLARLMRTAERLNVNPSEIIDEIVAQSVPPSKKDARISDTLRTRLLELLAVDTINLHVKAWELLYEEERYITALRIITDLRPLFDDSGENHQGAVIVNHLHVNYVEDQEHHNIFFALDEDDIEQLISIAGRAKSQMATLKKKAEAMVSVTEGKG